MSDIMEHTSKIIIFIYSPYMTIGGEIDEILVGGEC